MINEIIDDYPMLNNTAISYWDEDLQTYVYCGIIPVNYQITLPINLDNPVVRINVLLYLHLTYKDQSKIKKNNQIR